MMKKYLTRSLIQNIKAVVLKVWSQTSSISHYHKVTGQKCTLSGPTQTY